MKDLIEYCARRLNTRSLTVLGLLGGSLYLALADPQYRDEFVDLAKIGLGGYLGQLVPGVLRQDSSGE